MLDSAKLNRISSKNLDLSNNLCFITCTHKNGRCAIMNYEHANNSAKHCSQCEHVGFFRSLIDNSTSILHIIRNLLVPFEKKINYTTLPIHQIS